MRIYISSTFEDLLEHRSAVMQILRQLGYEVVAMEDYVAADAIPLKKVLEDVRSCDLYVGIFAWRYGYVPEKGPRLKGAKPGETSITEYEYRQALAAKRPVLAFLLEERAPWPVHFIDREPKSAVAVNKLRTELQRQRLVSYFTTPDQLAARVSAAVSTAGMRAEVQKQLIAPVSAQLIETFTDQSYLSDSHTMPIMELVASRRPPQAATINLKTTWWSTRLFLLAALGQKLGSLERILVFDEEGYIGMVSATSIRSTLRQIHKEADLFEKRILSQAPSSDIRQTTEKYINGWNKILKAEPGDSGPEKRIAETVTAPNLRLWFGEALLTTSVQLDDLKMASAVDLLRIMDYPNDFVPVSDGQDLLQLVNKAELANKLAHSSIKEMLDRSYVG